MRVYTYYSILFFLGIVLTFSSCTRQLQSYISKEEGYCQTIDHSVFKNLHVPAKDVFTVVDSSLLRYYSYKTLLMANASDLLPYLKDYQQLRHQIRRDTSTELENEYTALRSQMQMKLLQTISLIQSISSELDCEGERADLAADYLEEKENRRVKIFTVLSITTAAVASSIAAIISDNDPLSDAVEIAGGVTSATFGIIILKRSYKMKYQQKRNLLADIWNGPDSSTVYPPAIWYILNKDEFNFSQSESIREHTKNQWKLYGEKNKKDHQTDYVLPEKYIADEAIYDYSELRDRAKMINQLQARIRLLNQELQVLIVQLGQ